LGVVPPVEADGTTHGMCRLCAEQLQRQEMGPCPRVLVVVRSAGLAAGVAAALAALGDVVVVPDRRAGQRRRGQSPVPAERRQLDRRRSWVSQRDPWSALGIKVVPIQEEDSQPAG
jgi:hypothetical protein